MNLTVASGFWTWILGKLFLPEAWFEAGYQKRRKQQGMPDSLKFKTKVELAWEGIQEVMAGGLAQRQLFFNINYNYFLTSLVWSPISIGFSVERERFWFLVTMSVMLPG